METLINLRIKKGAELYGMKILNLDALRVLVYRGTTCMFLFEGDEKLNVGINDILYDPSSNFFTIFDDGLDNKRKEFGVLTYADLRKRICVTSKDPIDYLLTNINENNYSNEA